MMKNALAVAVTAVAMSMGGPAIAQQTLSMVTLSHEQHPFSHGLLMPWAKDAEKASAGALKIDVRHGMVIANHQNVYDRVSDGVVDIGFLLTSFDPGRFGRTLVTNLPFLSDDSAQRVTATCRMYERGAFNEELKNIVPLLFVAFPQASMHLRSIPITKLEDIKGRKIIAPSPAGAVIVAGLGGAPVSFHAGEWYEALQRGTAEGFVTSFSGADGFKLGEFLTDHYDIPMGGALGIIFMSRGKFDALPEKVREAFKAKSVCEQSRKWAAWIKEWEAAGVKKFENTKGHTINRASAEQVAAMRDRFLPAIEENFNKRTPGGEALVKMFKEELAAAAKSN